VSGELAFLWGLAGLLILRATWLSVCRHRHLAWVSAAGGPLFLAGSLWDQDLLFLPGIALMIIGEFMYQMNDEAPPEDRSELQ
jgi:hypothetical protein